MDALRRGGEPARDGESMLLPPVDREGMRRKAGSAVECELRLRGGRCRKLCIGVVLQVRTPPYCQPKKK